MKNLSAFLLLVLLSFSCKVNDLQKSDSSVQRPFYIDSFLGKWDQTPANYSFTLNEDQSMVLCTRYPNGAQRVYDYTVYDMIQKKEVYSSGFIGAEIFWKSKNEVTVTGTSRTSPDEVIVINVLTGESAVSKSKSTKN